MPTRAEGHEPDRWPEFLHVAYGRERRALRSPTGGPVGMIRARALDPEAFARFGEVIRAAGTPRLINAERCARFHDLARIDVAEGKVGLNLFRSDPAPEPVSVALVERHPLGSQAFVPLSPAPFLVVVAEDRDGVPGPLEAFVTAPGEGVNYARATWHGVLTPLGAPQDFVVIDYVGDAPNLEEFRLDTPVTVAL